MEGKGFSINSGDKVLFIRYSALGDIIKVIPFVRALKDRHPDISLTWLVATPWDELIRTQPYVDDVIVWEQKAKDVNFIKVIREIRRRKFDKLISLQGTDRGTIMALLSGVPVKVGSHRWANFVYTHVTEAVENFLGLSLEGFPKPWILVPDNVRTKVSELLAGLRPPIIFSVIGASKPIKRWPVDRWVELCRAVEALGGSMVLVGHGEEEEAAAEKIVMGAKSKNIMNLVGRLSLIETAALASLCDAAVGGDTGFMHLANAMGLPAVGLFGPTLPGDVGLSGIEKVILTSCEKAGCERWDCPNQDCLGSIEAKQVIDSLKELLRDF